MCVWKTQTDLGNHNNIAASNQRSVTVYPNHDIRLQSNFPLTNGPRQHGGAVRTAWNVSFGIRTERTGHLHTHIWMPYNIFFT
jgi:hypothetical protein